MCWTPSRSQVPWADSKLGCTHKQELSPRARTWMCSHVAGVCGRHARGSCPRSRSLARSGRGALLCVTSPKPRRWTLGTTWASARAVAVPSPRGSSHARPQAALPTPASMPALDAAERGRARSHSVSKRPVSQVGPTSLSTGRGWLTVAIRTRRSTGTDGVGHGPSVDFPWYATNTCDHSTRN